MSKSQETMGKKDREKKRRQKKDEKLKKKEDRKANATKGKDLEDMMAYIDENGNLTNTKPDPTKKKVFRADDISISTSKQENDTSVDVVRTGKVTFFNTDKGYGFIKDLETQQSVFVHVSGLSIAIAENDKVTFRIENGQRGLNAVDVKKA